MKINHVAMTVTLSLVILLSGMPGPIGIATAHADSSGITRDGKINLNSASKDELMTLPDVNADVAQKIIDGRPYISKADMLQKKVIPPMVFYKILNKVEIEIVKEKKAQPKKAEPTKEASKKKSSAQ